MPNKEKKELNKAIFACVDLQSPHIHATKQDKGLPPSSSTLHKTFKVLQNYINQYKTTMHGKRNQSKPCKE
jgi:hypothetical protein